MSIDLQEKMEVLTTQYSQIVQQVNDAVDGTTTWKETIQAVKDANPKP
jgi:hypothetical protein